MSAIPKQFGRNPIGAVFQVVRIFVFLGLFSSATRELPRAGAASTIQAASQVLGITTGIQQPPTYNYGTEMNNVNSLTGTKHGIVLYYIDWYPNVTVLPNNVRYPFLENQLRNQMSASDVPITMIAWQPSNGSIAGGCDQDYGYNVAIPPDKIIQGTCDTYIRKFAQSFKGDTRRYLLKFAHEMNSSGRPYWPGNFGETPATYVSMWRHVHDVFASAGVTNVEWVWAPIYQSAPNTASNDVHLFYPGDDYVDWVGPMGYNYYTQYQSQPWLTFEDIFDSTLKDFACRYPKPQIIHEFASVDGGAAHPKTTWIADAYLKAQNYPFLRALVWYNDADASNSSVDFRVASSTDGNSGAPGNGSVQALPVGSGVWTTAYKNAVASSVYTHNLPSLSTATPPGTFCGDGLTTSFTVPGLVLATPGSTVQVPFTGWMYANALTLSLTTPSLITGSVTPTTLPAPWGEGTIRLNIGTTKALGIYQVTLHTGESDIAIQVNVVSSVRTLNLPFLIK